MPIASARSRRKLGLNSMKLSHKAAPAVGSMFAKAQTGSGAIGATR